MYLIHNNCFKLFIYNRYRESNAFQISFEAILNNNEFLTLKYFEIHFNIHIVKYENHNFYSTDCF